MLGLSLVQHWLLILALFELPAIMHLAQGEPGHLKGYASNLEDEPAERRTWAFMLALLVLARLHAATDPDARMARIHCAAVHVLEAFVFGGEKLVHGAEGSDFILGIIFANAAGFSLWAAQPLAPKLKPY